MQLPIIARGNDDPRWYDQGLRFTCSQCGNCCTGGPGYVWISGEEIARLASHLNLTAEEVVETYCRTVDGRLTLKERRTKEGNYDCIFLKEVPLNPNTGSTADTPAPLRRKTCSIYALRPLQCRTWPFWEENLLDRARWDRAARRCHGMNHGRHFARPEVEAIRDAADWPNDPPTSGSL